MLGLAALGLALVAVAACGGGSGSAAKGGATGSSDEAAVKSLMQQELADARKGNDSAAYAFYSPKAQAGCSLSDFKAANANDLKGVDVSKVSMDVVNVTLNGETASATYVVNSNGSVSDQQSADFEKISGRWYYSSTPC